MGVAQMEQLDVFIDIKRKNALLYKELLSEIEEIEFLWEKPWAKGNFWFYTVKVPKAHKKSLIDYLISRNIQVRPVWKPIHTLLMYKDCQVHKIESAMNIYDTVFNLPCSVSLKEDEITFVCKNIKDFFVKTEKRGIV